MNVETSDSDEEGLFEEDDDNSPKAPVFKRARLDQDDRIKEGEKGEANPSEDEEDCDEFSTGDAPIKGEKETKTSQNPVSSSSSAAAAVDPSLLVHAKSRLSKWAARLFDPSRPKGLVQAPETIPLNDEYLKAFGQRIKSEQKGNNDDDNVDANDDIQHSIYSDDEDDDDDNSPKDDTRKTSSKAPVGTKIKIANLPYAVDASQLQMACETYGPLQDVNLIMNKDNPDMNSGRAFVTFVNADDAQFCVENFKTLMGRPLRVGLASENFKSNASGSGGGGQSLLNRYWEKDISTKCFRCGGIGHMESNCTNPAQVKPCFLCGLTDHDDKTCQFRKICFNCGSPGHVNRDCPQRRGMPKRLVCGVCFQSGHHKFTCRSFIRGYGSMLERDAICMECGLRGHFLCRELTWFFGLRGISCFNCGRQGHLGYTCERPLFHACRDDPELGSAEIERAEAESIADQLAQQRQQLQQAEQRGRQLGRDRGGREDRASRHRSQPPPQQSRNRGYQQQQPSRRRSETRGYR